MQHISSELNVAELYPPHQLGCELYWMHPSPYGSVAAPLVFWQVPFEGDGGGGEGDGDGGGGEGDGECGRDEGHVEGTGEVAGPVASVAPPPQAQHIWFELKSRSS